MKNENLGKQASDIVTGFVGTILGFAQYLTGCDQYLLVPKAENTAKYPEGQWFDSNRLNISENCEKVVLDTEKDQGPSMEAPKY